MEGSLLRREGGAGRPHLSPHPAPACSPPAHPLSVSEFEGKIPPSTEGKKGGPASRKAGVCRHPSGLREKPPAQTASETWKGGICPQFLLEPPKAPGTCWSGHKEGQRGQSGSRADQEREEQPTQTGLHQVQPGIKQAKREEMSQQVIPLVKNISQKGRAMNGVGLLCLPLCERKAEELGETFLKRREASKFQRGKEFSE